MSTFELKESVHRVYKGFGAVGLNMFLQFLDRIALIPLFSFFWGADMLSEWLVLFTLVTFTGTFIAGVPTHTANVMTQHASKREWFSVNAAYTNGFVVTVLLCLVLALIYGFGLSNYSIRDILSIEKLSLYRTNQLLILLIIFNLVLMLISLPSQAYRAFGMFARGHMIGNMRQILLFIGLIIGLYYGLSPIGVAALYLASLTFDIVWLKTDLPKKVPYLKLKYQSIKRRISLEVLRDGILFSVLMLGPVLSMQGSVLIASNVLGASAILGYILMRTLINFIGTVSYSFGRVLWPEITLIGADNNIARTRYLSLFIIKVSFAFGCILAVFVLFGGRDLLSIWAGVENVIDADIIDIMTIALVSRSIYGGSSIFCMALSNHRLLSIIQIIGGLITVVLTIILVNKYALKGVAIAYVIPDLLFSSLPALMISSRISTVSLKSISERVLFPILCVVLLCSIYAWLVFNISFKSEMVRIIVCALLYFPVATLLTYSIAFNKEERSKVKNLSLSYILKGN